VSHFKDTIQQIGFRLGLHPDRAGAAYSAPQNPDWIEDAILLMGKGAQKRRNGGEGVKMGGGRETAPNF